MDVGGGSGEGGGVPNYEYMFNKPESELLTGQAEYPQFCECLGSRLAMERSMMKSSKLCYTSPPLRLSTSHPPDVIHVVSVPRPSPFFAALPLPRNI